MVSNLIWIFTARCNLSCSHCYVKPRLAPLAELSLEEKIRIINEAYDLGIKHIGFSGGEPLIHPHFFKLAKRCYEYDISVSTVTNGFALNSKVARELAKLDIRVILSLDGPNRETHEFLRGRGTWDKVLSSIDLLQREGVRFSTVMAVHRYNYWKVSEYLEFIYGLGLDRAAVIPVMKSGLARERGLAVTASEYIEAIEQASAKAEELALYVSLWCTPFAPIVTKSRYISSWSCRLVDVADIDPAGRILLCDVLDIVVTNIPGKGLSRALEEFEKHLLVKTVTDPQPLPPVCERCRLASYCRGGCFARAYLEEKSLKAPDPLCPLVAKIDISDL